MIISRTPLRISFVGVEPTSLTFIGTKTDVTAGISITVTSKVAK